MFRDPDLRPDEANLRRAVEIYVRNTEIANGICAAIEARCFFVLQPLIATKTPFGAIEEQAIAELRPSLIEFARSFYALAVAEMGGSGGFIDASAVLNNHAEDVFFDLGHVSAFGVPVVGEFIAMAILARLKADAAPAGVCRRRGRLAGRGAAPAGSRALSWRGGRPAICGEGAHGLSATVGPVVG